MAKSDEVRKRLRAVLKAHVGIRFGESSKALEAVLRTATCSALSYCNAEDKTLLVTGEALPEWMTSDVLDLLVHGLRTAFRPESHCPEGVQPAEREKPKGTQRSRLSKAFEYWSSLYADDHKAQALKMKTIRKHSKTPVYKLQRLVAGKEWKKMQLALKHAVADQMDRRDSDTEKARTGWAI